MWFDESVRITRTPAEVYAVLADVQEFAVEPGSPVTAMTKIPTGPTRPGTRWREVVRVAPGLSLTMWSEVTECVPERTLALRFWGGSMKGSIRYTLGRDGATTVLRQQEIMRAVGWLRPWGGVLGRMLQSRLSQRLHDIASMFQDST